MNKVIIHADDYAVSEHIAECVVREIEKGTIDSVSVMPNMKATEEGIRMLSPFSDRLLTSIHLNLVEGKCVAEKEQIPLLTDRNGYFKLSWGQILLRSFRKEFLRQAEVEFRAQIEKTHELLKQAGFTGRPRIDSHQHVHMIPGLFLIACRLAVKCDAEYVRLAREPILPFLKARELWKTYRPVNLIKNLLLNIFSLYNRPALKRMGIGYRYFFGLMFTGRMDYDRVCRILPLMPKKHGLEVVLHVGRMLETEITEEFQKKDFIREHTSPNRLLEMETVERLGKWTEV